VVFTSDNGGERFSKTWPLNGRKGELLEGGIRVPAIVRWPARVRPGRMTNEQTITMDWSATFLDVAGASMPAGTRPDALSLLPVLAGGKLPERTLYWRHKAHKQAAARRGDFKYLSIEGHEYLFDIGADPQERANLKTHLPDRFAALKAAWQSWNAELVPYPPGMDSEDYHGILPDRY
jgi:arylsulfatase A-like enzyme